MLLLLVAHVTLGMLDRIYTLRVLVALGEKCFAAPMLVYQDS